jgi:hypothetical protein
MKNKTKYLITFVIPSTGCEIVAGSKEEAVAEARSRGLVRSYGPVYLTVKEVKQLEF